MNDKKQLGRILLKQKAISQDQLDQALSESGGRLASRLTEQGEISGIAALKALSEQYGIPGIDLDQVCVRLKDLELLPRDIAERHLILPILSRDDRLFVAMANPREKKVIDELEFVTGKRVYPYVALEGPLGQVIEQSFERKARGESFYIGPKCPDDTLKKMGVSREQDSMQPPQIGEFSRDASPGAATALPNELGSGPANALAPLPPISQLSVPGVPQPAGITGPDPMSPSDFNLIEESQSSREAPLSFSEPVQPPNVKPEAQLADSSPEIIYEDFGDLNSELSAVLDLPEQSPTNQSTKVATVLVVDDEAEIRRLLDRLLSGKGYRVLQADNGRMALKMVKEHQPDLMVLDAMLPEVHGFDIARRIKGSKRYGHIPIVMVSAVYRGWHYAEDLKQSCGVEAFIEKPFKIQTVIDAVQNALAGQEPNHKAKQEEMHKEAEAALTQGVAAYKEGRIAEAIILLKGGVKIDSLAYRLHFHLGLLYGRQGQVFEAIAALEQAVEINGRHFPAVKNLAVLYQKAGFRNKAAEMWHKASVIAPDEATRESVKKQLMSLL